MVCFLSGRAGSMPAHEISRPLDVPVQRYASAALRWNRPSRRRWTHEDRRSDGLMMGILTQPWSKRLTGGSADGIVKQATQNRSHPYQVANGRVPGAFDASLPARVEGLAILRNPAILELCCLLSTTNAHHGLSVRRVSRGGHWFTPRLCNKLGGATALVVHCGNSASTTADPATPICHARSCLDSRTERRDMEYRSHISLPHVPDAAISPEDRS
jgi:hypothetical protein